MSGLIGGFDNDLDFVKSEEIFSIADKKKLTNYLRLLSTREQLVAFRNYLKSDFRQHKTNLTGFFNYLEAKVYVSDNRPIRLGDLIKAVYKKKDVNSCKRKLRADFKKLTEELIRFRGLMYLLNDEAEMNRIQVEAIRNEGHISVYEESVGKWVAAAAQLPLGTKAAYHNWAAAEAGYFAAEIKVNSIDDGTFVETLNYFHDLAHHNYLHYENERFIRVKQYGEERIPKGGNELLTLQYLMACLHQSDGVQPELFAQLKKEYQTTIQLLSEEWASSILVLIQNYLIRMKRLGEWEFYCQEGVWLSYFFLEQPVFKQQPAITKNSFLNHLQNGIDAENKVLMSRIYDELGPKLPPEVKDTTMIVAGISLSFCKGDFVTVLKEVKKTDHQSWKDKYVDFLRLKSCRIRAAIVLYINDADYYEEAELALDDFKSYVKEHFKKMNLPVAKTNETAIFLKLCRRIITAINSDKLDERTEALINFCHQNPAFHARNWMISLLRQAGHR